MDYNKDNISKDKAQTWKTFNINYLYNNICCHRIANYFFFI